MLLEGPCTGYEIKALMGQVDCVFLARVRFDDLSDVEGFGERRKSAFRDRPCWKEKERGLFDYKDRTGGV